MKKLLAILLSVTMLLGCIVVAVNATDSDEKVITINYDEYYYLNAVEDGVLFEDGWNPGEVWYINDITVLMNFGGGDYYEFNINVLDAGIYDFNVIYACQWEDSPFTICVDGVEAGTVYHYQAKFTEHTAPIVPEEPAKIELTEGEHTIKLSFTSMANLWGITISSEFEQEVEVDNQGATENHGLTMTTGVGYLGLSYQFKTNAAFKAFAPKLGFFAGDRTIQVDITKRGSEEPIQTWIITGDPNINPLDYWNDPIGQSFWVPCELDEELPAGEYIVQIGAVDGQSLADVVWKKYDVKDELGLFESVSDTFDGEKETARNSTPAFKVIFTEEAADGAYFAKAGEPNVVAVDNQGAEEAHGLTITNGVGGLGLSYQFKTTAAFEAFSIKFGYFSADKAVNVAITALDSEEPVKTWTPNGFEGVDAGDSTGAWATFELDSELPAGEYIIAVSPAEGTQGDVIWKKYAVADANGLFESVGTFDGEKETARSSTPCLTFTFTEFAEDDVYFAKAGETPDEPVVEDTTAEETTAPETTAPETTAPETTAPETTAPETTAPETTVADTTAADTTVADTTAAGTEAGTAAGTAAGTKAPATTTAAAAEGCKAVVGSMSAIALVAIASAAAVVLKKKED